MECETDKSEIASILKQIETEYLAARRGLTSFAVSARHSAIAARMKRMDQLHQSLHTLIGDDSIRLIVEHLEAIATNERNRDVLCHVWEPSPP
ncbi:MAG TPA: hypothetical protein VFV38_48760 [Ktedonobacteraceae bacterium]|nr:hypothetical protein [Ktedonobacteraceae bacterium]